MSGIASYLEPLALNYLLRQTAISFPANFYIALYTVAPTDAGGGTEVSGGSYARQAVSPTTGFNAASGSAPTSATNAAAITFPVATASWGTIVAFGIFDASVAGNLLWWGTTPSTAIGINNQLQFAAGAMTLTLD